MVPAGFQIIPNWFSPANKGASVAVGDVNGNGKHDLIVLAVDSGRQPNIGAYAIGHDLDASGNVSGAWTQWKLVPDWFSRDTQGAGVAVVDLNGNGKLDIVVFMVDNGAEVNRAIYRVGHDLDADGNVTAGWSAWVDVPWFSWENQGAGIAIADLSGNGKPDIIVMTVDKGQQQNRGIYRVGRDVDQDGNATAGWSEWLDMPGWYSWQNQGCGVAITDTTGNGHLDIIVFGIDSPQLQNKAFYRIAFDVNGDGVPAGAQAADAQAGWSSLLEVNNWFSWENQGAGIAILPIGGVPHLLILATDHPATGNVGFYTTVRLTESPNIHGNLPEHPNIHENLPEHPNIHGNPPEQPNIHENLPEHPNIHGNPPEHPNIHGNPPEHLNINGNPPEQRIFPVHPLDGRICSCLKIARILSLWINTRLRPRHFMDLLMGRKHVKKK